MKLVTGLVLGVAVGWWFEEKITDFVGPWIIVDARK